MKNRYARKSSGFFDFVNSVMGIFFGFMNKITSNKIKPKKIKQTREYFSLYEEISMYIKIMIASLIMLFIIYYIMATILGEMYLFTSIFGFFYPVVFAVAGGIVCFFIISIGLLKILSLMLVLFASGTIAQSKEEIHLVEMLFAFSPLIFDILFRRWNLLKTDYCATKVGTIIANLLYYGFFLFIAYIRYY
ncbi:hypothetical protein [Helicobacter canadensis]|uniref:hypothetical protein n=1 Tax=Helicobacter canadensis TaxID=123841 RepID=UPI000E057A50|nr:hypothetical protein [Helicobacter canadensis]STP02580.1 Uncharacterised protein [Helicobacter canadensis]